MSTVLRGGGGGPWLLHPLPCSVAHSLEKAKKKKQKQKCSQGAGLRVEAAPRCLSRKLAHCLRDCGGFPLVRIQNGWDSVQPARSRTFDALGAIAETFNAGSPLLLDQLHGTWLLQYTTAPDVISILQAAEQLPLLQVGQVYQNFDCRRRTDGGVVENIVRWSVPGLLQENEGATLIVTAKFSVASARSIVLQFEEARVSEVEISEVLESFIAPALLPRTFINLQILQFLRGLDLRFPLARGSQGLQTLPENSRRAPIGLWYNLTFLDNNMLVGRALGNGGIFIFSRTQARPKSV
uniref:Plastid lipid-associated protein/fibrillin conserved domain-containing protein n=1 Tax=Physcomitrium patens TaxID=3218 RepID=A0A7I4A8R5_PHYPA